MTFFFVLKLQFPILFGKEDPGREGKEKHFHKVMGWVRDFLEPTGYVAGTDHLTVADLAFVATYSTIEVIDTAPCTVKSITF